MSEAGDDLIDFLAQTERAAELLSQQRDSTVAIEDSEALVCILKVDQQVDLVHRALTATQIVDALAQFDFAWVRPIAEFGFRGSLLPHGIPGRLDEEQLKHKNEIWRIYKNDADPHPSNPHAHNVETGYKLHLGNGQLYKKRDLIGSIQRKDLLSLREKVKHVVLPPLEA